MTTPTKTSHEIPYENLTGLIQQIDKLNKKVAKLNKKGSSFSRIEVSASKPWEKVISVNEITGIERKKFYVTVEVTGEAVSVNGWDFVATLQHEEGGTIVRPVPGMVAEGELSNYRDVLPGCDHCGFDRRRKDTFIVRSASGEHKQVGRNCLADFFKCDPHAYAEYAELLASAGVAADFAEGDGFLGERTEPACSVETYIPYVVCAINRYGWLSRTAAREQGREGTASADEAFWFGAFPSNDALRNDSKRILHPSDEEIALSKKVIDGALDYFLDTDPVKLSDYEHNLKVALDGGMVTFRLAGIIGSVVVFMQRKWGREAERKAQAAANASSEFQGEIGKRATFNGLTLVFTKAIESQFGVSHLYKFRDAAGNLFTWFSTKNVNLEIGKAYDVKGTPKKHEIYNDVKQTVLNRCVATEVN